MTSPNYSAAFLPALQLLAVILSILLSPQLSIADEATDESSFTINPNGTIDLAAHSVLLGTLLSEIGEAMNISVHIDNESKTRTVTLIKSDLPLVQLLEEVAGDNYVLGYENFTPRAVYVMSQGEAHSPVNVAQAPDFSGQVRISNQQARLFFMPAGSGAEAIEDYIRKRHEILAKLSQATPGKELPAQISFNAYLPSERVVELIEKNQLSPVTLNIGWKDKGGGYDVNSKESIEAAIESVAQHHERFIAQLKEDADRQVKTLRQQGEDSVKMSSALRFQQNANELNSVFHSQGLLFSGVRVVASTQKLHSLIRGESEVRLVDPLWGGEIEAEISAVYSTTKVAMPLVPDIED